MEAGLGILRLRPGDFWAMTPRELDAALRGAFGTRKAATPPTRGDLAELMKRYPDGAQHAG
ncbi:hypothetical protein AUC70_08930 [Methyloceanibacter stevinii]|uniref:Phage tail assembly chaperone n=2 Tax=Methyloceanibacter stevinii TaxID=1774970 RepID=A0A1E3VMG2_9HYPH|nr:hypothetical protein AUC70_08930 [Methyloceanibacter stevinii]